MSIILKIEKLTKKFGSLIALNKVSLEVPYGSIVLLIGPNGSGKTTLLNCISGLYKPNEGRILYKEIDITGKPPYEIAKLGITKTFQIPMNFKNLTVNENLLACYPNHPGEKLLNCFLKRKWIIEENNAIQRTIKVLKILNIDEQCNQIAHNLSGGQLKLLEFGKPLLRDSELFLLDEPVAGINPFLAEEILSYIQKVRNEYRKTFIIVEHRLDLVLKYVDYVYALAEGEIVCEGPPQEIIKNEKLYEAYFALK